MSKKTRFVLIKEGSCGIFCFGIFSDQRTAIGEAMRSVWNLKDSYRKEGDIFEYSEFEETEGECGIMMTVKFKAACWGEDMIETEYYYILDA